jgi:hypothetical protein
LPSRRTEEEALHQVHAECLDGIALRCRLDASAIRPQPSVSDKRIAAVTRRRRAAS